MRARRDELSSHQSAAVVTNLTQIGANYVPLLVAWCTQLLPEIAEEEEVRLLMLVVMGRGEGGRGEFEVLVLVRLSLLELLTYCCCWFCVVFELL